VTFSPLPLGGTAQSGALHQMWVVFFWAGVGVAIVIYGLIAWCVLRYRRRSTDDTFPPQFQRNNRMEIFYTAIRIRMVIALFFFPKLPSGTWKRSRGSSRPSSTLSGFVDRGGSSIRSYASASSGPSIDRRNSCCPSMPRPV